MRRLTPILALLLAACAGSQDARETAGAQCPGERTVRVSGSDQLRAALADAQPGDALVLEPGRYPGQFDAVVRASASRPIRVCAAGATILPGGGGYGLHLAGATWWHIEGIAISGGQKGLVLDDSSHNTLVDIAVAGTGKEGIHLRAGSTRNRLIRPRVRDTGRQTPAEGEGIYVGSARGNWCRYSRCQPDRSDRNQIEDAVLGPGITAESIDIKEGTTGGSVTGGSLDARGLTAADSWIDVKGNRWKFSGLRGSGPGPFGVQVHQVLTGWGNNNRFSGNRLDLQAGELGFQIASRTSGNRVACDNVVTGGAELANVACRR